MPLPFDFTTAGYDDEIDAVPELTLPDLTRPQPPAKPAPVQAAEAPKATDGPKHNPMTLSFAKQFGYSDQDIAALTPAELDAEVRGAHRQMLQNSREFHRNERAAQPAPKPAASPQPSPPMVEPAPAEPPEEEDELDFLDDRLKGRLKAQQQTIDGLAKELKESREAATRQQYEAFYDQVDAEFAKMPDAVQAVIGKGTRHEIENDSIQHIVRKKLIEQAAKDNSPGLSFGQKLQKAAQALAPSAAPAPEIAPPPAPAVQPAAKPVPPKAADGRFTSKPKEERETAWKEGGSAKPTHRDDPEPPGETKAVRSARKWMLDNGFLDEADAPEGTFLPAPSANGTAAN